MGKWGLGLWVQSKRVQVSVRVRFRVKPMGNGYYSLGVQHVVHRF